MSKLNSIKRNEYAQGYYFTKAEVEELKLKGYELVLQEGTKEERDLLADIYKASNHFTRVSFNTSEVRGFHNFSLWARAKKNVDTDLLNELMVEIGYANKEEVQEELELTTSVEKVKAFAIKYFQGEVAQMIQEEIANEQWLSEYINYATLFDDGLQKPNYKAVKKDLTHYLARTVTDVKYTSNFDIVTEDGSVVTYKEWFTEVRKVAFKK